MPSARSFPSCPTNAEQSQFVTNIRDIARLYELECSVASSRFPASGSALVWEQSVPPGIGRVGLPSTLSISGDFRDASVGSYQVIEVKGI